MDTQIEAQLDLIRNAVQVLLQNETQKPTFWVQIEWSSELYQFTQNPLILPRGLKVSGSWEDLKIEYETGQELTQIPSISQDQKLELESANNQAMTTLFTGVAVLFVIGFLYDILFKKLIR